jgi:hypothetical protein
MQIEVSRKRWKNALVLGAAMAVCGGLQAQQQTPAPAKSSVPDAQIEANVLKALASSPLVASQNIQSTTVYGVVTLSGNVTDDAARQKADDLTSRVAGVQKVVDEMTVGAAEQGEAAPGQPDAENQGEPGPPPNGAPPNGPPQEGASPYPRTGYPGAPEYSQNAPNEAGQSQQGYPQQAQQGYPPQQQEGYPPRQDSRAAANGEPVYGAQRAGDAVTIPAGALLRVRINEGLSSNRNQAGAIFDGIVINDVVADGAVAIPRGATVQGVVEGAKASGAVSGRGELTLRLTNVVLGGRTFPLNSDVWSRASGDKTVHTVNSALGLGVLGAIIGGVAGGGGGAAIGAAAGAGAGVATSAASPGGQVLIPPEAILTFHTTAPTPVVTVSQAEMDRLGYGVPNGAQPQMRRRVPPPPPPYYGRPYPY